MHKMTFQQNMTVFALFFGLSLIDAVNSRVWWRALFWLGIAVLFAMLAWTGERRRRRSPRQTLSS